MTRVYRCTDTGLTFVERGTGGGIVIVPDHGGPGDVMFRFRPVDESDGATLVHDDEGRTAPAQYAADAADRVRQVIEQLTEAIATAKIPAPVKAELRDAITRAAGADG
jgi:hypothetical protein